MQLRTLIRIAYGITCCALILMMWASFASAREIEYVNYPACTFNPLCTCSKSAPDLGIVQCRHTPFPAIPRTVNNSKVFMLHMENTGLREIESHFLQATGADGQLKFVPDFCKRLFLSTGLYRLEISHNPIADIPDDALVGLERSLWELMLHNNQLIRIPSRAIRHLQKLRLLDLTGNQISKIEQDAFRGLEDSLQTLILADNSISALPTNGFSGLNMLDTMDLSGNNLAEIDPNVFRDGLGHLSKVLLADNLLSEIPYIQMSPLKLLRYLDLSNNRIMNFHNEDNEPKNVKLSLDTLHLEYNAIETVPPASFQFFEVVNKTFLDGNPIKMLGDDAFRSARIRELYIRHCDLTFISPKSFSGLEQTLQILDMSGNNITDLPEKIFNSFDVLRVFSLKENKLKTIVPNEMFMGFQYTLFKLDLSGERNGAIDLQDLKRAPIVNIQPGSPRPSYSQKDPNDPSESSDNNENFQSNVGFDTNEEEFDGLRNLRSLSISNLKSKQLSPEDFLDFGVELEDLKISRAALSGIKAHAFKHVRGLKRLDFSENTIGSIDAEAFKDIGHSLLSLRMSHGLGSMSSLPGEAFKWLTSLQELDVSNNKLSSLSDTSFHFMKNLRMLEMHDNTIDDLKKGTFQGDIHVKLEEVSFAFNNIKQISQHTFVDLEALRKIRLNDNKIEKLDRRAFMNLDKLSYLNLRGNKLSSISDESFQCHFALTNTNTLI